MGFGDDRMAGLFLCIGLVQFVLCLQIAQSIYPNYNVNINSINDLGVGASGIVFNCSVVILGLCLVLASYYMQKLLGEWEHSILLFILGISAIGVGVFPETNIAHTVFISMAFVVGALAAIYSYRIERPPIRYLSLALGIVAFVAIAMIVSGISAGLGIGALDNIVAYTIVAWGFIFSGYLMGGGKIMGSS